VLSKSTAVLAVSDVPETVRFYRERLGFPNGWVYSTPTFGGVSWGEANLFFCQQPKIASGIEGHMHFFEVEDVNSLFAAHQARGVDIVSTPENKPWGHREYVVRDPNGYHLRFAGSPDHISKGTGVFPAGVTIEVRKPTPEEHRVVAGAAFYRDPVPPTVLETTWGGVVALGPDGAAIGTVRIMFDAPGWYSIWDVAVLPEWQGRRIGSAMMEAAVGHIRRLSPGANVFLFTYQHGFYSRLGFAKQTVDMIRV
jgi:catechol 2,3-dioxygenase-like lactoylglutathione lyase family enzyme